MTSVQYSLTTSPCDTVVPLTSRIQNSAVTSGLAPSRAARRRHERLGAVASGLAASRAAWQRHERLDAVASGLAPSRAAWRRRERLGAVASGLAASRAARRRRERLDAVTSGLARTSHQTYALRAPRYAYVGRQRITGASAQHAPQPHTGRRDRSRFRNEPREDY